MMNKIAIQGIKGSNHYKVVRDFITNDAELLCFDEFRSLCKSVATKEADFGIMAIENSIAGSILPNYRLLSEFNLHITAEHYLDIQHNLVALKGQHLKDITAVRSHQMALLQCGAFFEKHPHIKLIEDTDTALPAQQIAKNQIPKTGALVPDGTADLFGLEELEKHIQDHNLNSTRFVKVEKQLLKDKSFIDKASIMFELEHQPGALFQVLKVLNEKHINMTKIQSVPLQKSKWRYAFFLDIVFENYDQFETVLKDLVNITQKFKVLGHYKQAEK
jgi:prephenate dehydratase